MPEESRQPDPGKTSPLGRSAGASQSPMATARVKMGSTGPASPSADEILQEVAKSGTNIDTMVGRLVIDQGFATPEELSHCLAQAKSMSEDSNQRSLAQLLVQNQYVTEGQMTRIREVAERERNAQRIPGYKILGKLGAGAMATVYKGRQLSLDRLVAIKVLPKKFSANPQFIERFYTEGRAAAQLNHPNIVQAYDVGKAGELHYFVMEFVDGSTVYDEIVKSKRFQESEAVDMIMQVAEALQHAHEKGLIHRDVKPKNIMLSRTQGGGQGIAKLADMGLARAISDKEAAEAEAGKAFGTPYYISPEQIRGERDITAAADIYSLGATLYHMVTGAVPFDGKNPSAVMHKHLRADLVPPDHVNPKLSAGLSEVVEMMMAKDPKKRYQTARDLLTDLRAVKAKQPPPLAHKDIGGMDLSHLAKAEAAAVVEEIPIHSGRTEPFVRPWLFAVVVSLLVVMIIFNIILLARG